MLATLLLYAPWLPIFLDQFSSDAISRPPLWEFVTAVSHWLTFGATIELGAGFLWLVAGFLIVGLLHGRSQLILPIFGVLLPLGMMFATGTTGAEFYKFLVVAVPFWLIWLTAGLKPAATAVAEAGKRGWWLVIGLLVLSWGMGQSLQNMYSDPAYARADYRGMAARITAEAHPNAGIILNAPNQWEAFTYYFPDEGNVYPLPAGRSRPNPDDIDAALSEIAARYDRIYVLFWGEAQRDPERLVERWLDANAFKATDSWVGDVRFVTYAVPSAPAIEMATAVNLPFGDAITLKGYTLGETTRQPGDIVEVTLFWQTAVPLEQRYKVFLHLLDSDGNLVSQRDSEPGGGLALTTTWQPGQVVSDNHGLLIPSDLPPGQYQLTLGLYELENVNNRLPITTKDGIMDAYFLSLITISD
jgi:mannosyltransferase